MKKAQWRALGALVLTGVLALTAIPASAASPSVTAYVCEGGAIPSGTYSSITVKGACTVAAGATVTVKGNVDVRAGAMLDAQSAPATLTVGGNLVGAPGVFVGLGCQAPSHTGNSAHPCASDPEGRSTITVKGNIALTQPSVVLINGISAQNITVLGGGSGMVPWSVKNNTVGGNLVMSGQNTWWLGVLFNTIRGNLVLSDITLDDPTGEGGENEDLVYIVRNAINGNAVCSSLDRGVVGYGNAIRGRAVGQCAPLAA